MPRILKAGTTSFILQFDIADSASTTGDLKTGIVYNAANLKASYTKPGAAPVLITLVSQTPTGAWVSGGFCETGATDARGLYRLDVPNLALTGTGSVVIKLWGAAGMVPVSIELQLVAINFDDSASAGISNIGIHTHADIIGRLPASLVGGRMDSSVGAVVDGVLTAAKFASGAFDAVWSVAARTLTAISDSSGITALLSRLSATRAVYLDNLTNLDAQVSLRLPTASYTAPDNSTISAINTKLGTPAGASMSADLAAVKGDTAAVKLVTDKVNTALVLDGAVYQYTANALELAPTGGGGGGGGDIEDDPSFEASLRTREVLQAGANWVQFFLWATAGGDPITASGYTVQVAFLASEGDTPTWNDCEVVAGRHALRRVLVGTGGVALTAGLWFVKLKITATPETVYKTLTQKLKVTA